MSTPVPDGSGRSSLRTAGVVLVGLALVLTVIGALTGTAHDAPGSPVPGSSTGLAVTTGPVTTGPATTGSAPATTSPPLTSVAPTTTSSPAPSTAPSTTAAPDPRTSVNVVVLNNSTVRGLASRAAVDVRGRGWTVAEVGNFTGTIPTTTVYYRPGTVEEAAARVLGADLRARVEPRFDGLSRSADGIVLVVTSDYAG